MHPAHSNDDDDDCICIWYYLHGKWQMEYIPVNLVEYELHGEHGARGDYLHGGVDSPLQVQLHR